MAAALLVGLYDNEDRIMCFPQNFRDYTGLPPSLRGPKKNKKNEKIHFLKL
jgi:hypothetical protein